MQVFVITATDSEGKKWYWERASAKSRASWSNTLTVGCLYEKYREALRVICGGSSNFKIEALKMWHVSCNLEIDVSKISVECSDLVFSDCPQLKDDFEKFKVNCLKRYIKEMP